MGGEYIHDIVPVDAGHEQVGEHHVDVLGVLPDQAEAGLAVAGLEHVAELGLQHAPDELAHHGLVIDDEGGGRGGAQPTRTPSRRSNSERTIA